MDLRSLQCFASVAEHLNFSRAAEALYISQPSLSIRIKALEDELGVSLFYRTHQQVFLTSQGAALLPEVLEILARIEKLPDAVRRNDSNPDDQPERILVGMDPHEERTDLPFLMAAFTSFQEKYPSMELRCTSVDFEDYEEKLLSGEYDMCLMVFHPEDVLNPMLAQIPLLREPCVLYTEGAKDLTLDEVLQTREILLASHEERWNRRISNWLAKKPYPTKTRAIIGTPALCMNLHSGKTASFLPQTYAEAMRRENGMIYPVDMPETVVSFSAVWNKYHIRNGIQLLANELLTAVEQYVDPKLR